MTAQGAPRHRRAGYTLIELVTAIAVAGIVSALAGTVLLNGSFVLAQASQRTRMADSGARAMEQILRFVREIGQDVALTGKAQISTADSGDLRFGVYGFRVSGSELQMTANTGTTWYRACTSVSTLTFRYYDATGAELTAVPLSSANREAVRQVSVELAVTVNGETHRVRTRVYLRNLMSEAA
ncbi:MAG: type II secretion system protein [Phycisphaerae bacterium]